MEPIEPLPPVLEEIEIEIPKILTLEELKAQCTKTQIWSDEKYSC